MKRFVPRIHWFIVLVFSLCSIGANTSSSGCKPSDTQFTRGTQADQNTSKPWCHTDPPIFCAAYCSDYDKVSFTKACWDIGADLLELQFELKVMDLYQEKVDQGTHLCVQADPFSFLTPCNVGIIPQEWPDQDHEVCQPVPPGCPM